MPVNLHHSDWFRWLSSFVQDSSGIVVPESRGYLAETRLTRLLADTGDASVPALVNRLRRGDDKQLVAAVVDAFTTNETSFLRDPHVFDMFADVLLPDIVQRRTPTKRIRIWSAACSTGQEPYSIAMLIRHGHPELEDWTVEIVATDLSRAALETAMRGVYRAHEIQRGLPEAWQQTYFQKSGRTWKVNDEIRDQVQFLPANLTAGPLPKGPFDAVFLRNVLIYFDEPTRHRVFSRVRQEMTPSAPLLLGGAEGATSTPNGFFDRHVTNGVHWLKRCER